MIGPAKPSRELLQAAEKLTQAAHMLREANIGEEMIIGPPPPSLVSELESANEDERFEEVARILSADANSPDDILGITRDIISQTIIKKKYWKLSLLVHPDKCSHPQAHQAFVILNKAFNDVQNPNKRGATHKIPTHSTTFRRSGKEGRGDTSAWTDTPLKKANEAKQNYLEAYNKAKILADAEEARSRPEQNPVSSLIDMYNTSKRCISLVEKNRELKKKQKTMKKERVGKEKEESVRSHPWKPWNRERDLPIRRKHINLDRNSMAESLISRFSGATQRTFL